MMHHSQHITIKYHFFHEAIKQGIAYNKPIETQEQLTDFL